MEWEKNRTGANFTGNWTGMKEWNTIHTEILRRVKQYILARMEKLWMGTGRKWAVQYVGCANKPEKSRAKRNRDLTVSSSVVFKMSSSRINSKKSVMKPDPWHGKEDTSYLNISINIYTYALVSRISQHLLAVQMKGFKE
jgi:hypothetical protein